MLFDTAQILWHGGDELKNDPIMSLDVHALPIRDPKAAAKGAAAEEDEPTGYLLATAGTDGELRLWIIPGSAAAPQTVAPAPPPTPSKKDKATPKRHSEAFASAVTAGPRPQFLISLVGHERCVNVARFSPDGLSIATASDGGGIVVWHVDRPSQWARLDGERGTRKTTIRGSAEDLYDLCWSPDSTRLLCGSMDGTVRVWDVSGRRIVAEVHDHATYVQGVAWDPAGRQVATQGSDRSCRLYRYCEGAGGKAELKKAAVIKAVAGAAPPPPPPAVTAVEMAATMPTAPASAKSSASGSAAAPMVVDNVPTDGGGGGGSGAGSKEKTSAAVTPKHQLFVPETDNFFRRLTWLPDGSFLACPTGQFADADGGTGSSGSGGSGSGGKDDSTKFCTFLFLRDVYTAPAACLRGLHKPSVAVRCCPLLFKLRRPRASLELAALRAGPFLDTATSAAATAEGSTNGGDGRGCGEASANEKEAAAAAAVASAAVAAAMVEEGDPPLCDLPYRVVFAVATIDTLLLYDTQHHFPLAVAAGLHYAQLTDLSWSSDGRLLVLSSADGYVTTFRFAAGELGEALETAAVPAVTRRLHPLVYRTQEDAAAEAVAMEAEDRAAAAKTATAAKAAALKAAASPASAVAPAPAAADGEVEVVAVTAPTAAAATVADDGEVEVVTAPTPASATAAGAAGSGIGGTMAGAAAAGPAPRVKTRVTPTLIGPCVVPAAAAAASSAASHEDSNAAAPGATCSADSATAATPIHVAAQPAAAAADMEVAPAPAEAALILAAPGSPAAAVPYAPHIGSAERGTKRRITPTLVSAPALPAEPTAVEADTVTATTPPSAEGPAASIEFSALAAVVAPAWTAPQPAAAVDPVEATAEVGAEGGLKKKKRLTPTLVAPL